jgi:NADPH-dependent glutamate synthase beta subunit-like oxidoreductase
MIAAISLLMLLGLSAGVVLAIASRVFYVWEDPRVLAVSDALPGANCGGCGYAGCMASAEAIAAGKEDVNVCVVGGMEVAQAVGEIMGKKVEAKEPEFSWTSCTYGIGDADPKYLYNGAGDCRAAVMLYGGSKLCPIGCIGLGSCVKACQFDALKIGDNNLPVVNYDNCVGCGACVKACPKNIVSLTSATLRIQKEYRMDECTAPCQRACPTGIDIPKYIGEIREGRYEEALQTIKEKCPLPLVCGYICPAPCEQECRRNLADEPVAIDPLKRFVSDYEMETGKHIHPYAAPDNGRKIAVVGGGSEGLTLSYYLARLGYRPTIFEAKPELGGILRYVISEDRLPREVLEHDINGILDIGIEAKTGMAIGRDFTFNSLLQEDFNAVVMTTGGFDSRKILHPEQRLCPEPFKGFHTMLDFLLRLKRGDRVELGYHVLMVNCGPKALELAHRCQELGVKKVTIVTGEGPETLSEALSDAKALRDQGIEVKTYALLASLGGKGERLTSAKLESNDPRLQNPEIEILDVDSLILPLARIPELTFTTEIEEPPTSEQEALEWITVDTFRSYPEAQNKGMLATPEPGRMSDSSAVVKSILSGRRLARAIHQHLSEETIAPVEHLVCDADHVLNVTSLVRVGTSERQRPPVVDVEGNSKTAWIFPKILPGLDEEAARREAERCLQCGLICYKKPESM